MVQLIEIADNLKWHLYRGTGVGASETAVLLNLNPYMSALQLFHKKIGFKPMPDFVNFSMEGGLFMEDFIDRQFRSYDPDELIHARNFRDKKYHRETIALPKYSFVVNSEINHAFSSPDRICKINGREGYVEIKNTSSYAVDVYEDKIPIPYSIQIKTQMMLGEMPYGYLSFFIDGRRYFEKYFERDSVIFNDYKNNRVITEQDLKDEVETFWQSVVLGRELSHKIMVARQQFQYDKAEQYQALLDECEPSPDYSTAYEVYLKDTHYSFAKPKIEKQGTIEDEQAAENFLKTKEQMKAAEEIHQKERNNILNLCKRGERIIIGKNKYIEVSNTKVGISIKVKN